MEKIELKCLLIGIFRLMHTAQWLKITEKVSFKIASEASYAYILCGQKLIKNAKNGQFWQAFENLQLAVKQYYQTCHFWRKIPKLKKFKFGIFGNFQTL